jgi:MoxR-like ATPase
VENLKPVLSAEQTLQLIRATSQVRIEDCISRYIVAITQRTRTHSLISSGISPRGSLHLASAAQGYAFVDGRDFVTPDDVKMVCPYVLAHRLELRPEVDRQSHPPERILGEILAETLVPQ